jgi:carbamoyl-phosphate synthase large subunit
MLGATIDSLRGQMAVDAADTGFWAVKEAVLPWNRFPQEDIILGPEMRATGEVMGIADGAGIAFGKALAAAGLDLPGRGNVFFSLADRDKAVGLAAAQAFTMLGYELVATSGTARYLAHFGVPCHVVPKLSESDESNILTQIEDGHIDLVVNTPRGGRARSDGRLIRTAAQRRGIPCVTTVQSALATARSLQAGREALLAVRSLQDWHR